MIELQHFEKWFPFRRQEFAYDLEEVEGGITIPEKKLKDVETVGLKINLKPSSFTTDLQSPAIAF